MDEIVREYLPEAFAFIYVINCTNKKKLQQNSQDLFEEDKKVLNSEWLISGVTSKRVKFDFLSTFHQSFDSSHMKDTFVFYYDKWKIYEKSKWLLIRNHSD